LYSEHNTYSTCRFLCSEIWESRFCTTIYKKSSCANGTNLLFLIFRNGIDIKFQSRSDNR